ncbi:hypothetical protein G3R49_19290 [Shewanella sp. WXL01]|uniref:portal protein n=1 Tax=Shewanella sp. WXL01 TaxID=2709721 RepID=UPI0014386009|nr:hypothetical protein [Shewanella sp. WXL01]NKF52704.1 hypothetical protein [Shewanella sp. WXL01]
MSNKKGSREHLGVSDDQVYVADKPLEETRSSKGETGSVDLMKDNKTPSEMLYKLYNHVLHNLNNANFHKEERVKYYQEAWQYYLCQRPLYNVTNLATVQNKDVETVETESNAPVAPIIRDINESVMPSLLNVFCENENKAVVYRATNKFVTTRVADAVNNTINEIFLRQNDGYKLLQDAFLDALVTGNGFSKQSIQEVRHEDEIEIIDWMEINNPVLLEALEEYPDTDLSVLEMKEEKPTEEEQELAMELMGEELQPVVYVKGLLPLLRVEDRVVIERVPFGELYVDPDVYEIEDARYITQRHRMTVGEACDMGFDPTILESASTIDTLGETTTSNKKILTQHQHTNEDDNIVSTIDPIERPIYVYETYMYSSALNNEGKSVLYQIFHTENELLSVCEADCIPYCNGKPENITGSFWGHSMHDKYRHIQDHVTRANKIEIEAAIGQVFPRYEVVKGSVELREMLNWKPSGVVQTQLPGSINPIYSGDVPATFKEVTQRLIEDASKGEGKAAGLGLENSLNNVAASTVAFAVQNAELKDKTIAKSFANTLIKPMFEQIYKLIRDNDLPLKVGEGEEPITGKQLPKRCEFHVDINTANDDARISGQLMNVLANEADRKDTLMDAQQRYNVYEHMLNSSGVVGVDKYLTNPETNQPSEEEVLKQELTEAYNAQMAAIAKEKGIADLNLTAIKITEVENNIKVANSELAIKAVESGSKEAEAAVEGAYKATELELRKDAAKLDAQMTYDTGQQQSVAGFPS